MGFLIWKEYIDYIINVMLLCNMYEYYVTKLRKRNVLRQANANYLRHRKTALITHNWSAIYLYYKFAIKRKKNKLSYFYIFSEVLKLDLEFNCSKINNITIYKRAYGYIFI